MNLRKILVCDLLIRGAPATAQSPTYNTHVTAHEERTWTRGRVASGSSRRAAGGRNEKQGSDRERIDTDITRRVMRSEDRMLSVSIRLREARVRRYILSLRAPSVTHLSRFTFTPFCGSKTHRTTSTIYKHTRECQQGGFCLTFGLFRPYLHGLSTPTIRGPTPGPARSEGSIDSRWLFTPAASIAAARKSSTSR